MSHGATTSKIYTSAPLSRSQKSYAALHRVSCRCARQRPSLLARADEVIE